MNFKADDYLAHHGVKGMKWRKHKYKLVKGADGKLHYIYDTAVAVATTQKNKATNQNMNREIRSRKDIKPLDRFVATGAYDPRAHYEYTKEEKAYLDKERAEKVDKASKMIKYGGKFGPALYVYDQMKKGSEESKQRAQQNQEHSARSSEAANRAEAARKQQVKAKEQSARSSEVTARANAAKEKQAAAVAKEESRLKRQAQAEANKAQVERRKRMRQAEANKEQVDGRKRKRESQTNLESKAQTSRQARAEGKDKVVGKMSREYLQEKRANTGAKPLTDTRVRSGEQKQKAEKIIAVQRKKDAIKKNNESIETNGQRTARASESTSRHQASVKAQEKKTQEKEKKKNKRKKTVSDVKRFINGFINRK